MRTPVTVTVRVTVSRGAERGHMEEKCSHDESKAGWEREVEAEKQGGRVLDDWG